MRAETRHQLKEDRFSRVTIATAGNAVHWTVEHQRKLIGAAVVLLVIVGAGIGIWYYQQQQNDKANVVLGQALRTAESPLRTEGAAADPNVPSYATAKERADAARTQFQSVINNYPHTTAADIARYFNGTVEIKMGNYAAAENDLKPVTSVRNDDLSSLAKFALASVYRNTNRPKDAINLYNEIINKPSATVGKSTAQMELAATYEAMQQPADAKRIYEQVQKDNATGQAAQMAATKLQGLK
ncbi:MAG: tetratricopeptide repeat protein [Acidobacteriales bacterium]|nr:tetratricopeptide repeat protein [Terriglobales bacterium]